MNSMNPDIPVESKSVKKTNSDKKEYGLKGTPVMPPKFQVTIPHPNGKENGKISVHLGEVSISLSKFELFELTRTLLQASGYLIDHDNKIKEKRVEKDQDDSKSSE